MSGNSQYFTPVAQMAPYPAKDNNCTHEFQPMKVESDDYQCKESKFIIPFP